MSGFSGGSFEEACAFAKQLSPSTTDQLRLYGLYKQATAGDVSSGRPYAWDVAGRAKWDAWKSRSGVPQDEARLLYAALLTGKRPLQCSLHHCVNSKMR